LNFYLLIWREEIEPDLNLRPILLTGQKNELIIPVRPILKKELNLWLAELGFEKIKNYDSFDCKSDHTNGYDSITAAYRPGSSR
jgi:hypothetical protein